MDILLVRLVGRVPTTYPGRRIHSTASVTVRGYIKGGKLGLRDVTHPANEVFRPWNTYKDWIAQKLVNIEHTYFDINLSNKSIPYSAISSPRNLLVYYLTFNIFTNT